MKRFYFITATILSFLLFTDQLSAQPTAVCVNGISIDYFWENCSIEIWASDFDAASFADSGAITGWRINRVFDVNENGQIDQNELLKEPPTSEKIVFEEQDLDKVHSVQFWVIDQDGNYDFCMSFVEITGKCGFDSQSISGRLESPKGAGLSDMPVKLNGGLNHTFEFKTDAEGNFLMHRAVLTGKDYNIVPMSDSNWTEGVDNADIDAIIAHIIGNEILDSPYKLIAADVNNDGKVSVSDIQVLRKNLLGLTVGFPNNKAWRFVVKGYFLSPVPRPAVPVNFPEMISLNDIQHNEENVDFIGIKIGDVVK